MIARKPKKLPTTPGKFIAGRPKRNYIRVITNFEQALLDRVDSTAAVMGLTRSAFIVLAAGECVRELERQNAPRK